MAAASVGVARPPRMLPRVPAIRTASGTIPTTNSLIIAAHEVSRSSIGTAGPSAGLM